MNTIKWISFILLASTLSSPLFCSGISVDAGLTPAKSRYILRTQVRSMNRNNEFNTMNTYALVGVFAYGIRNDLTLVVKQPFFFREKTNRGFSNRSSGFVDTRFLLKYKIYRKNTAKYIFGFAATVEIKAPTGHADFSTELWDVIPGFYSSIRFGKLAADMAVVYSFNGVNGKTRTGLFLGDELKIEWAASRQIPLDRFSQTSIAPVLETSYSKIYQNELSGHLVPSGESALFFGAGLKLTQSSFIIEALYRFVLAQTQGGSMPANGPFALFGLRYMF